MKLYYLIIKPLCMSTTHKFYFVLTALSFLLFSACKKNSLSDLQSSQKMIEIVHRWYSDTLINKSQLTAGSQYSERIRAVQNLLDWESAKGFLSNSVQYVITPLKLDRKPFQNKAHEAAQSLVFYFDKSGEIHMKAVEIIAMKDVPIGDDVSGIVEAGFLKSYLGVTKQTRDISAYVIVYDENYKTENSYSAKEGSLTRTGFKLQSTTLKSKLASASRTKHVDGATLTGTWETWYLVGIYYDIDTGEVVSATILSTYQVCSGSCDVWTPTDDPGGTGGGVEACVSDTYDNARSLTEGVQAVSVLEGENVSTIDALRKHKNPDWKILSGPTWALHSHETGIVRLDDIPTNKWVWESLTHTSITFSGASIGGSITYSQGTGTPSFVAGATNVLYAGMSVSFNVTYAPLNNCPSLNVVLVPYTLPYTSSAIWSANP